MFRGVTPPEPPRGCFIEITDPDGDLETPTELVPRKAQARKNHQQRR